MILPILYPYLKFVLGTLYPSYKTWKALKRKDETTRRRWMKYWVSYGAFQSLELMTDFTVAYILPFYIELKLAAIIWLVLGTKLIFDSIVNRELTKREKSIDRWLKKLNKIRDEIIAIIWFELSRCSVKIFTAMMSGGLSVLAQAPELSKGTSPVDSDCDGDETEVEDTRDADDQEKKHEGATTRSNTSQLSRRRMHYTTEPDFNENTVLAMEWSTLIPTGGAGEQVG